MSISEASRKATERRLGLRYKRAPSTVLLDRADGHPTDYRWSGTFDPWLPSETAVRWSRRFGMAAIARPGEVDLIDPDFDAARSLVLRLVLEIAPQLDIASVDDSDSLHDVGDIDSLDFLRLVELTSQATGAVVAPRDYARLVTLDGFARYLMERQVKPVDP